MGKLPFFGYVNAKSEIIAALGETVGTALFLFLGLGGIKTALASQTLAQTQTTTAVALANTTILFISTSMGLSLLVTAWLFYRITGGLFNPAVTLALWLVGAVSTFRSIVLVFAQIVGGIAGSALLLGLTPQNGVSTVVTTLQTDMSVAQGVFMEAFLTAALVFAVLMLAAEKHRATYLAPIGIGLTLFVCQLLGTLWTGCGMNPARSFGPSVVSGTFPSYHWIYWVGPLIGSLISVFIYTLLKAFDYGSVVLGQDSDDAAKAPVPVHLRVRDHIRFSHQQRKAMLDSGVPHDQIDAVEKGMVHASAGQSETHLPNGGSLMTGAADHHDRETAVASPTRTAVASPITTTSLAPPVSGAAHPQGSAIHFGNNVNSSTTSNHSTTLAPNSAITGHDMHLTETPTSTSFNEKAGGTGGVSRPTTSRKSTGGYVSGSVAADLSRNGAMMDAEGQEYGGTSTPGTHPGPLDFVHRRKL